MKEEGKQYLSQVGMYLADLFYNQNKMKQTAVEWLVEKIQQANPSFKFDALIRQAKQMEKEQIMNAWLITKPTTYNNWRKEFEQYYNETFKSK